MNLKLLILNVPTFLCLAFGVYVGSLDALVFLLFAILHFGYAGFLARYK